MSDLFKSNDEAVGDFLIDVLQQYNRSGQGYQEHAAEVGCFQQWCRR